MRYFVLLVAITLFTSCGLSPQEQLIADKIQTLDGTIIDLKFKPLKTEFVKSETAKDSLLILTSSSKYVTFENALKDKKSLEQYVYDIDSTFNAIDSLANYFSSTQKYDDALFNIELATKYRELLVKAKKELATVSSFVSILEKYHSLGDSLICKHYKCTYKIFNPLLQTEQEITKTFVFNGDETVILNSY